MAVEGDEFRENQLLREAQRRQDRDDFNNEMAGREVGLIKRFLPEDAQPETQKAKRDKHAAQLSRLAMMMQIAEYAALYGETVDLVHDHATKAEAGLDASQSALRAAGQTLESITDRAAKIHPSGEPVFRDENGNAVRADATPLTPEEGASVVWPDDAPSYQEYLDAKKAYTEVQTRLDAWREYQFYVGSVQDRLEDQDNPPTEDELKQIQKDIHEGLDRITLDDVQAHTSPEETHQATAKIGLPDLGG